MRTEMARPLEVPVIRFYTPDKRDKGLIELWNTEVASYVPLDIGAVHPNTRDFSGYKLGKQLPLESDERYVVRIWVTDEVGSEWFGYAVKYLAESNTHPVFIRNYREPRLTYAAKTKGQPLKAVYKVAVTLAGTGYTPGTFPALTFSGGAGTGAAGHAVVNPNGTIAEFVLDDGGDNYTSAPTFTVAAPPSGTTATGTAFIQPATAVLVAEEAQEFPQDSEFYGLYLNVVRVYQTLPGPELYGQEFNRKYGIAIPYIEQEILAGTELGSQADITPIDSVKSKKRSTNTDILRHLLSTIVTITPDSVNLDLPDVLNSLTVYYEKGNGVGIGSDSSSGSGTGDTWFYKAESSSAASSSASIIPEVVPDIDTIPARNMRSARYAFFIEKQPNQTLMDVEILAKLTLLLGAPVTAFPQFRPKPVTLILKGQKKSVEGKSNKSRSASSNSDGGSSTAAGNGSSISKDISNNIRAKFISPTIHPEITITDATDDEEVNVYEGIGIPGGGGNTVIVNGATTVEASVEPTVIPATNITAIPTTGFCFLRARAELFEPGFFMVDAEVFDWEKVWA